MRKIDLTSYQVIHDGKEFPYLMRESLAAVLFAPGIKINPFECLRRDDLARRIEKTDGQWLLLEEAEYEMVKRSVNAIDSFSRDDAAFIRRVLDAPTIEVAEKNDATP